MCFYSHRQKRRGQISKDFTGGYGLRNHRTRAMGGGQIKANSLVPRAEGTGPDIVKAPWAPTTAAGRKRRALTIRLTTRATW